MSRDHTTGSTVQTENTMTIGELSEHSGLSTSAIRFYQRRGLLPGRSGDSGWQRFEPAALDRLAVIELAKSAGFTLDEVTRILDALDVDPDSVPDSDAIWRGLAQHKIADIDARIARLQQMRQLLGDALNYSYVSPERARRVTADLGWIDEHPDEGAPVPAVALPTSTRALAAVERDATPAPVEAVHRS